MDMVPEDMMMMQSGAAVVVPIVSDAYDRADSNTTLGNADTGQAWTALSGTWGISTNKAYLVSQTAQAAAVVDALDASVKIKCSITLSPTLNRADCGLVFNVLNDTNYLLLVLQKDTAGTYNVIRLYKRISGAFSVLQEIASAGLVNGQTYAVTALLNGLTVAVYVDSVLKIDYTLSAAEKTAFNSNTKHGIRVTYAAANDDLGSRFDNFEIYANPL